jgi:cell division protein FtsZ
LGDEMSVTVIATGIGCEDEPIKLDKCVDRTFGGKVRDITPSDLDSAVNYDEPTFIRRQHAVGENSRATYRGYKGIIIDNNDLDVPTFLRKKAD